MAVTYVARRRIKIGNGYRAPGEAVPEFLSWNEPSKRAHISLGFIEVVDDEAPKAPEPQPVVKKTRKKKQEAHPQP
jgi:hypothetical protein